MQELGLGQPEIAWHTVRDRIAEVGCFLGLVTGTLRQDRIRREADDADRGGGGLRAVPRGPRPSSHHAAEAQPDLVGLHHRLRRRWCASTWRRCSTPWSRTTSARPARGRSSGSCCRRSSALGRRAGADALPGGGPAGRRRADAREPRHHQGSDRVRGGDDGARARSSAGSARTTSSTTSAARWSRPAAPLVDLLAENAEIAKHMSRAELDKLCDPANYLGHAGEMVDRVLSLRRR